MCGRYALQTPVSDLANFFDATPALDDPGPRFNIAPTEIVPVVGRAEGGREIVGLRWGLVPSWARAPEDIPLIINARVESLVDRPAFRDLLPGNRCIVPADGFFEWRMERGLKQPYYVRRRDGRPLALAGLRDRHGDLESCAILTTDASPLLRPLHDRMPVVLSDDGSESWLGGERDWDRVGRALAPEGGQALVAYPVDRRVNRVGEDDPGIIEPRDAAIDREDGWRNRPPAGRAAEADQLGLFG